MSVMLKFARRALVAIDPNRRLLNLRDDYFKDPWLRQVKNIVHAGANAGLECTNYARHDLGVLWIEPIPTVFEELKINISPYPKQIARRALVTDRSGDLITFNLASNGGESSSIFKFGDHKDVWPDVEYVGQIEMVSQSLDDILASDPRRYDGLVMDTQGSELLILKGATASLSGFKYIKTEAASFEMYIGAPYEADLVSFLRSRGFYIAHRRVFAKTPDRSGEVSDLLFRRLD